MKFALVTESSPAMGTGHMQRMCTLCDYIQRVKGQQAVIVSSGLQVPGAFPCVREIPAGTDLIIRDMRDSSVEEMERLRRSAPVVAVDDRGPGREAASSVLDLLPHPAHEQDRSRFFPDAFLFGYNFSLSVRELASGKIFTPGTRKYMFALYPGADPSQEHISFLLKLLPAGSSGVILCGREFLLFKESAVCDSFSGEYAGLLTDCRLVVSHFGLTLYEGSLAGASAAALNPGIYHSRLADLASREIKLVNAGLDSDPPEKIRRVLASAAAGSDPMRTSPDSMLEKIMAKAERFYSLVTA